MKSNKNVNKNTKLSYNSYKRQQVERKRSNNTIGKYEKGNSLKNKKIKEDKREEKKRIKQELKLKKQEKKIQSKKNRQKIRRNILKAIFSESFALIVGIILLVLLLSMVTYNQSQIATIKYSINKKNSDMHNLDNEIKLEMIKIDEASRSDIIEKRAIEELGMQYREQSQIEYIILD